MEVVIASPMTPEDAERVAAVEGIELTYRPELLPTRKWVGDINGEGGVPLDDERWKDALERAEVVFGIPGSSAENLVDLVRRAPRLEWVQARNAGAGQISAAALALAEPVELDRIMVTTSSGARVSPTPIGSEPSALALSPDGRLLFAVDGDEFVSVVRL